MMFRHVLALLTLTVTFILSACSSPLAAIDISKDTTPTSSEPVNVSTSPNNPLQLTASQEPTAAPLQAITASPGATAPASTHVITSSEGMDKTTVVLSSKTQSTQQTVIYFFKSGIYHHQLSTTVFSTEEAAKTAYINASDRSPTLNGKSVSFEFISPEFKDKSRQEVLQYWNTLFTEDTLGFYDNYSLYEE